MNNIAIRTDNLTRTFGNILAVDHLSIEVPRGSVFGFLGPNGAGKTTTIRLLLGLLEPTSGTAEVLGYDTRTQATSIREHCGALLEYSGLYERLSAQDNLDFYARVWHMPAVQRQERIHTLLDHFGLWDRRSELAGNWSRGMKQKLAVARALLHHPELIFLDEPTAGLDPVAAVALREDLSSLAEREGVTVFLTTHNLGEAEKLCHQVGVIRAGQLLEIGSLEQLRLRAGGPRLEVLGKGFTPQVLDAIKARPEIESVELQDSRLTLLFRQPVESAPLVSLLVSLGVQVEEVHKDSASLEEVFLTLMNENNEETPV